MRERDRLRNEYPRLHYPELYILKGGYKEFFLKCQVSGSLGSMAAPCQAGWWDLRGGHGCLGVSGDVPGASEALEPAGQVCIAAQSPCPGREGAGLGERQMFPDLTRLVP